MKFLLDTCTISDFVNGRYQVGEQLLSHPPSEIAVSTVTLMEIEYGLRLNPAKAKKIEKPLFEILEIIHQLPFEKGDALAAANIRLTLKKQGLPIGPYDLLIAGAALNRKLILVTSNEKEFSRVKDLKIENWRNI